MAKYLYDKTTGNSLLVTESNKDRVRKAYEKNKARYRLEVDPESYVEEAERRSDISSTPITTRGDDRVHASDVMSLSKQYADEDKARAKGLNPMGEPIEYPVQETPRAKIIREMYTEGGLDKQIQAAQEQADVDEYHGWVRDNPLLGFGASIIAPSTYESIKEGKMPGLKDVAIDVPLALTTLLPPLRGATMSGTVAKNAAVGAGIGAATEGALQAAHEREFNPADIALSGAFGAGGGSAGGILTGIADKRLAKIVPVTRDRQYITSRLGRTQQGTIANLYQDVPRALKEMGETSIPILDKDGLYGGVVTTADIPYTKLDDLNRKVLQDIKRSRLNGDMDFETAEIKRKILDDFNKSILDIASSGYTEGVPFSTMLTEAERLYAKDPELGADMIKILRPYIEKQRYSAVQIASGAANLPVPADASERISKSVGDKIKKMQLANMYAKTAPKEVAVDFAGDKTKYALDALRKSSPEFLAEKARAGGSVGTRLAPRAVSTASKDDSGEPQYDNQGNLLYAPEGQRGYDWLWKEADKVKAKAKSLKKMYSE